MNLKTNLAHRGNYGDKRAVSTIKYIVIHYTANDGDTDEGNGNYFKNNDIDTSAHYFVDDDSVTQSVPDNYVAWHCGTKYTYKHKECRNANSIGVEICDDIKNGVVYPSQKTIDNTLELVRGLMKKYNIPKSNVIRHYDVTGKLCPAYWCGTTAKDKKWKTEFWDKLEVTSTPTQYTNSKIIYRVQVGAFTIKGNADRLANELKSKGYSVIVVKSGVLYRVQVGAFSVKSNADKMAAELKKKGYSTIIKTIQLQ